MNEWVGNAHGDQRVRCLREKRVGRDDIRVGRTHPIVIVPAADAKQPVAVGQVSGSNRRLPVVRAGGGKCPVQGSRGRLPVTQGGESW